MRFPWTKLVETPSNAQDFLIPFEDDGSTETSANGSSTNSNVEPHDPEVSSVAVADPSRFNHSSGRVWTVSQSGSAADFQTVGEAVAACSPGDTVKIEPGMYNEWIEVDIPIHIVGEGDAIAAANDDSAASVIIHHEHDGVITWTAEGGSITNLVIYNEYEPAEGVFPKCLQVTNAAVALTSCGITGTHYPGGITANSSRIRLSNCLISRVRWGIRLADQSDANLEDNTVRDCYLDFMSVGIDHESSARLVGNNVSGTVFVKFGNNYFERNVFDSLIISGGCLAEFRNNEVSGLIQISDSRPLFDGNTLGTIAAPATMWIKEGSHPTLRSNRITGRQLLEDLSGVTIAGGAGASVEHNYFCNCQGPALVSTDGGNPIVRCNNFYGNRGYAIYVRNAGGTFEDNEITANEMNSAVLVDGDSNSSFSGNLLQGNSDHGLAITDGARATLNRNRVINHRNGHGIAVANGSMITARDNTVTGNANGIVFIEGGHGDLLNNDFRGNTENNVVIDPSSRAHFNDLATFIQKNRIED